MIIAVFHLEMSKREDLGIINVGGVRVTSAWLYVQLC